MGDKIHPRTAGEAAPVFGHKAIQEAIEKTNLAGKAAGGVRNEIERERVEGLTRDRWDGRTQSTAPGGPPKPSPWPLDAIKAKYCPPKGLPSLGKRQEGKGAGAADGETMSVEEALCTCSPMKPYSPPSLGKSGRYVAVTPGSFAEVSSENARAEFETLSNKVSEHMAIPSGTFQYDDRYFSKSFQEGTTDLSAILGKGEVPSIAAGYEPFSNTITISRGIFALKDSKKFFAQVRIVDENGKEQDVPLKGKGARDRFVKFVFVHEGVHYLRNRAHQAEFKPRVRRSDCAVELHLVDPNNRDTSHPVTAKQRYDEEVWANSIAAVYYFKERRVPESVKEAARGLGLLK